MRRFVKSALGEIVSDALKSDLNGGCKIQKMTQEMK